MQVLVAQLEEYSIHIADLNSDPPTTLKNNNPRQQTHKSFFEYPSNNRVSKPRIPKFSRTKIINHHKETASDCTTQTNPTTPRALNHHQTSQILPFNVSLIPHNIPSNLSLWSTKSTSTKAYTSPRGRCILHLPNCPTAKAKQNFVYHGSKPVDSSVQTTYRSVPGLLPTDCPLETFENKSIRVKDTFHLPKIGKFFF